MDRGSLKYLDGVSILKIKKLPIKLKQGSSVLASHITFTFQTPDIINLYSFL